jgi:hypothetical protein
MPITIGSTGGSIVTAVGDPAVGSAATALRIEDETVVGATSAPTASSNEFRLDVGSCEQDQTISAAPVTTIKRLRKAVIRRGRNCKIMMF